LGAGLPQITGEPQQVFSLLFELAVLVTRAKRLQQRFGATQVAISARQVEAAGGDQGLHDQSPFFAGTPVLVLHQRGCLPALAESMAKAPQVQFSLPRSAPSLNEVRRRGADMHPTKKSGRASASAVAPGCAGSQKFSRAGMVR
jgi:hypothetical protein